LFVSRWQIGDGAAETGGWVSDTASRWKRGGDDDTRRRDHN
jgi:hypothetical protein